MSSYPGPIAILPIFYSQEFNYSSSSLTVSTADKRYLRLTGGIESGLVTFNGGLSTNTIYNGTGTFTVPNSGTGTLALTSNVVDLSSNQTIGGQKNFSIITTFNTTNGIPSGQAFNVNSFSGGYQTRLYSVNNSYSTDLYYPQFNGIDTLVSTASTQNLTNKTISVSKFGTNGTTINLTQFGRAGISTTTGTVTFPNTFASTPTVSVTLEQSNTAYVFVIQVTATSTTGFSWRQYGMTIAAGSTIFAAGDLATIHWVATA